MSEEVWADIIGYEGLYQVSNLGRVKSLTRNKCIAVHNTSNGYLQVHLYKETKPKYLYIHRLVAETFCDGKSSINTEVNHIDGNRTNNLSSNLEWCTRSQNHKTNIYIARQKAAKAKKSISVKQYDMSGNFIREYSTLHDAEKFSGAYRKDINSCCKGLFKTAGGYVWQYA